MLIFKTYSAKISKKNGIIAWCEFYKLRFLNISEFLQMEQ